MPRSIHAMFYARDGLYFRRFSDGNIEIGHEDKKTLTVLQEMTHAEWIAMISSMAIKENTADAEAFHK